MAKINNPLIVLEKGKDEQTKTVDLAMADGNQTITPDSGKTLSGVTVTKPATMLPANIKKDVNIGGVVGTLEEGIDISDTTATAADVRVGKNFYVANGTKTQGTIADYDGQTSEIFEQTLTTLEAVLSKAQYGMSSVSVGSKIYLHGQKENFEVFDTTTNTLQTLNSKTLLWTYYGAMAAVDNKVYLFDAQGSNHIAVLDITTDTIQDLSKTYNNYASGVAVGTKIYLFGGEVSSTETNKICVFDTTNNSITTLSSTLPTSARRIGAVAVGTKIYLFGGDNSSGTYGTFLNTINVFDTNTNTLSTLDVTLPTPASAIGVSAIGKKIYLFGGMTINYGKLSTINVFDTETNTISTLSITLSAATLGISASTIGNNIYLFGGQASNSLNSIQEFSVQSVASISITDKNGVTLKTQSKYCPEDVSVKPNLQTKTATANGDISPDDGYCGLEKVTVNVPAPTLQTKTVTPTKSRQIITPDSNYKGLSQVTVNAIPNEYIIPSGSQNITANGTYDIKSKASVIVNVPSSQPTLNAPTISLSDSTITITNPSSNGNFVISYKVFNGTTLLATVTSTTVDLSAYLTTCGTYTITVKASGTNFNDSASSNSVTYTLQAQTTPVISLVSGTTIQIDTIDDNVTTIEVYADGTKIGEVAKQ